MLLAEFSDQERERRSYTPLPSIPKHVALAAVASEDRRFFRHMGLDLLGIGRATARNVRAGTVVEGGSTISQQLAKNIFLSRQRTFTRKLHEALLAVLIEFRYSKEQILEFYLNQIYLGQRGTWSVCGVEEGALFYFNKHASELTLGEGALLAGIIPAPNRFSPYRDAEAAIARRNEVLEDMVSCGFISKADAERARRTPLRFAPNPAPLTRAPYFVDYVREVLSKDISEADLSTRGLQVFTTLDPHLEDAAERAVREGARDADARSPSSGASRDPAQSALLAIEPQNGAIRAMVGGRDYRLQALRLRRGTRYALRGKEAPPDRRDPSRGHARFLPDSVRALGTAQLRGHLFRQGDRRARPRPLHECGHGADGIPGGNPESDPDGARARSPEPPA